MKTSLTETRRGLIKNFVVGTLANRQPIILSQQKGIGIDGNRPGAGAPNVDKSGNLKVRKGQTLTKSSSGRKCSTVHVPLFVRPVGLI